MILVIVLFSTVNSVLAQSEGTRRVELKLLEILRQNGVISEAQAEDVRKLADELRKEEDDEEAREKALHVEVTKTTEKLEERAVSIEHRPGSGVRFRNEPKAFELSIRGRIQFRFTADFFGENAETDDDNEFDFAVAQARLDFRGHAFDESLRYKLLMDLAGDTADTEVNFLNIIDDFESKNRLVVLKDAYLEFAEWEAFRIRGGQFRVPYSRATLTGSGSLEFVDRSILHRVFSPNRDVGLMIFGSMFGEDSDVLEYAFGIFNGEGDNRDNDDKGLLWAGRVAVHPFGELAYTEGDLKRSGKFKAALGINAFIHQDDQHADAGDVLSFGADLAARYAGFFSTAEVHYREEDQVAADDPRAFGWSAQLGAMLIEDALEIAIRAANIDWDNNGNRNSAAREYLMALGYYLDGHDLKVQADFGYIEDHEGRKEDHRDEWRLRMQVQLAF